MENAIKEILLLFFWKLKNLRGHGMKRSSSSDITLAILMVFLKQKTRREFVSQRKLGKEMQDQKCDCK